MARDSLSARLMAQILDHVRAQDLPAGQHLPAQALADCFRVSRAPVVAALRRLQAMGLVRAEANRGFFLAQDAASLPALDPVEPQDESLYLQVAEDRLAGRLPDRVSENELMRLYEVGRAALIRVLHRIAEEGWIDRLPGHGWQFRETLTSRRAYADAYQFRAAIEMQALLLPTFRVDPVTFAAARRQQEQLLARHEGQSRTVVFGTNVEFHETLMACACNSFFLDAVRRVNRLRRLIEYRVSGSPDHLARQCREHLRILDLIEAGEMQAAATFLYHHIRGAGMFKAELFG